MAKLVMAVGVPHGPMIPWQVANEPGKHAAEALMNDVRQQLEAVEPDVIIETTSDHFSNFSFSHLSQFCLGIVDEAEGPVETYCPMPRKVLKGHPELGKALLTYGLRSGFDLAAAQELRLDHSVLVPLHFLTPDMNVPVVPLYTNGLVPPLPQTRRCYNLGRMIRRFIDDWDSNLRVAFVASGVFSLEIGGPNFGRVDEEWTTAVRSMLEGARHESLIRRATEPRMLAAGNVSGELLNWITMAGTLNGAKPVFMDTERGRGYAVWKLD